MQEDKEKEMTKDVVVSLKGLQLAPDQQSDAVEVIAPGEYYICLLYTSPSPRDTR